MDIALFLDRARKLAVIWKDAARDIFNLRDELDTCKTFLESIQSGIVESSLINDLENHHGAGSVGGLQREALKVLLRRCEQMAQRFGDRLIELLGEHTDSSGARGESDRRNDVAERTRFALRKKLLWLRRLESVSQLRKMLRRTADDIALCLTMMNVKITAIHATRGPVGTASVFETSEANIIARLTDTVESSKEDLQNAIEGSAISVQESIQATIDGRLEESFLAMSTRFEHNILVELRNHRRHRLHRYQTPRTAMLGTPTRTGWNAGPGITSSRGTNIQSWAISGAESGCQCMCHYSPDRPLTDSWQVSWLRHVFGSLRIIYRTLNHSFIQSLGIRDECHSRSCGFCSCIKTHAYTAVRVEYSFPPWLMNAIVSMYFTHYGQPELLIRINRVVSSTEDCFTQSLIGKIWLNDLEAVKNILACCPSSLITVSTDGRSGLLHVITHRRTDIAQVLLQAGADPFQQCDDGLSPALQALCLWLRGNDTNEIGGIDMIDIMPFSRAMEEDNFTKLHRIVIGFLPIHWKAQINSKTASGLTPLHLAAQYHKTTRTEIELLLAAGARTNDVTTNGHSSLSYACLSGNEAVVEALLEAGTSPPTAFTQLGPDPNVLDCLVTVRALCSPGLFDKILRPENGVDINGVNYWGITPITCAVGYDNFEAVGWLIEREADIDTIDPTGYTPLQSAIFWNAHQSARTLLGLNDQQPELASLVKKGLEQRYRYVNPKRGRGTCHSLAEVGDKETMEIFAELRMTGMPDVSTFRDIHGKTALDLFQARTGVYVRPGCYMPSPPEEDEDAEQKAKRELVEAWRKLLGSINQDPDGVEVDTAGNNNHIAGVPGQEDQGNQEDGDQDSAGVLAAVFANPGQRYQNVNKASRISSQAIKEGSAAPVSHMLVSRSNAKAPSLRALMRELKDARQRAKKQKNPQKAANSTPRR
ncbi:hypothetical protein V8F06_013302 [Rhypophila decipiens]